MACPPLDQVLWQIRRLACPSLLDDASDGTLLARFVGPRDQAAFAELVRRHGAMVLSVCRHVLRDPHAAEDAFQATFLVLVRRAATLEKRPYLGSWLYGVAYRTARKARAALQRWGRERQARAMPPTADQDVALTSRELQPILTEELDRLPEKYRAPLVLCYLQGKSTADAARHIGCPRGTILSRLAHARDLLRTRLARRGLPLTATALPLALTEYASAALPPALGDATAGLALTAGKTPATASVAALADAVLKEWLVQKLRVAAAAALVLAMLGLGAVLSWPAAQPAAKPAVEPAPAEKLSAQEPAPANEQAVRDVFGDALPQGALARLGTVRFRTGGRIRRAVLAADGKHMAVSGDGGVSLLDMATGHSRLLLQDQLRGHSGAAFVANGNALIDCDGETLALWDVASARKLGKLEIAQATPQEAAAESPAGAAKGGVFLGPLATHGKLLAVATQSGAGSTVRLWNVATREEAGKWLTQPGSIMNMCFSPDGKMLVCIEMFEQIWSAHLREPTTGKEIRSLGTAATLAGPVAFAPDSRTVAAAASGEGDEGMVVLWDVATGEQVARFQEPAGGTPIKAVAFSPDGKTIAWGGWGPMIHLCDIAARKEVHQLRDGDFTIANSLAFTPDGSRLYAADDWMIRVWDTVQGKQLAPFTGHDATIEALAWRDGGRTVVTFARDNTCRLWDASTGRECRRSAAFRSNGHEVATFDPAGTVVFTSNRRDRRNHELLVWDVATGSNRLNITLAGRDVTELGEGLGGRPAFSPDGKLLAASLPDSVCLFDAATGKVSKRLLEPSEHLGRVVWSPDGRLLAVAGAWREAAAKRVEVVDVASGKLVCTLEVPDSPWDLAFSPDGRVLAEGGADAKLRLWETATGKLRRTKTLDKSTAAHHLAWSPDSRTLAWAARTAAIQLWNVCQDKSLCRLEGHRGRVECLAFSPDGTRLVSGSDDTTALIWDLKALRVPAPQPVRWKDAELASLWADLGSDDAAKAFDAAARLVAAYEQTPPVLSQRIAAAALPDRQRLAQLVADVNSTEFAVRQQAGAALEKLGNLAELALRQALEDKPPLEFRQRIERLLERLAGPVTDFATLRALRAIEVLERIGTPAANQVLRTLANGAEGARLTREAKASLGRLAR